MRFISELMHLSFMDLDFLAITISPQLPVDYEKCMVKLGKDSSILPPYFYKDFK